MQKWQEAKIIRRVDVLLFDRFSNHCLANTIEPLRAANDLAGERLYTWRFLSMTGAQVTSSSGLPVMPEAGLTQDDGADYLIVMPSYDFRQHATGKVARALRAAAGKYAKLIGMDTGAWLLAAAGLLDGRRATIHWDELDALAEQFPNVEVFTDRFVADGNCITCGGVTTAFDLILSLIREHHGPMLSIEVASMFMHGIRNDLRDIRPLDSQLVNDAISLMRREIEYPLRIPEIAGRLRISRKKLEELFLEHTGSTPQSIYKSLRLREARRLAQSSGFSIAEIATRCGYADPSALTRAFQIEYGHPPSFYRGHRGATGQA
ncbi:GlxA family transcriptional regulator [Paracoccus sp. J56]|uniref:GlxA family transcriptional regulator n=1 Tax=Paracoccus sp. J56 TaxID=935850 RepID=UPI000A0DFC35|nr:helix-turn-helix domain-containing protein [Paracoccus sp. J56]SMG47772.1 transcriptional regulator, AraC family with amidase-like domain [Paracoccus sp. J56]